MKRFQVFAVFFCNLLKSHTDNFSKHETVSCFGEGRNEKTGVIRQSDNARKRLLYKLVYKSYAPDFFASFFHLATAL